MPARQFHVLPVKNLLSRARIRFFSRYACVSDSLVCDLLAFCNLFLLLLLLYLLCARASPTASALTFAELHDRMPISRSRRVFPRRSRAASGFHTHDVPNGDALALVHPAFELLLFAAFGLTVPNNA